MIWLRHLTTLHILNTHSPFELQRNLPSEVWREKTGTGGEGEGGRGGGGGGGLLLLLLRRHVQDLGKCFKSREIEVRY